MVLAVGIALVMACGNGDDDDGVDDNQFRSDVLDCESAAAHLQNCCGASFDPRRLTCHHLYVTDQGCGDSRTTKEDPDLTEDESDCLLDLSCDAIKANNTCARVEARGDALNSGIAVPLDGGGNSITAPVCP